MRVTTSGSTSVRRRWRRPIVTAAVAVALATTALVPVANASPLATSTEAANPMLAYTVQATAGDAGELGSRLADAGFDVVGRDGDTLTVLGDASLRSSLGAQPGLTVLDASLVSVPTATGDGADASQDSILPRKLDGNHYETYDGGYRTVDGYDAFEGDLAAAYPKLVKLIPYGESWSGQPLNVLCVTADADKGCQLTPDAAKPRFLVVGQTHARELTTSELMWRYLTYLVDGYKHDAQVTGVLQGTEVWIAPQVNPDGVQTVEQGIIHDGFGSDSRAWQRKNINDEQAPAGGCPPPWANSQAGIDINRNFDVDWGHTGTSKSPCSSIYGGPSAASEPETIAQQDLFAQLYRDRRGDGMQAPAPDNTTGSMLTLHSYADEVLLPWGFTTQHAPNDTGLRSFGFRMSYFNGFAAGQAGEILYNSSGATEDWLYDQLGVPGFTWEVGPNGGGCGGFFPDYVCQDDFFANNVKGLMYTAAAAQQPYTQTLGPTTLTAKAKGGKAGAKKVSVKATIDDDAYGAAGVGRPTAQNVTAARIYVGKAPWAGGTPIAMKIKGAGTSVKASAKVSGTGLAYVQGKDADGHWGPIQSVWLSKH